MEEKKNSNGWHAVERKIFSSGSYHLDHMALEIAHRDCKSVMDVLKTHSEAELYMEGEALMAEDLLANIRELQKFLDYPSMKEKSGNPYAGNWLLVREPNVDSVFSPEVIRRLDDFASLRHTKINGWFGYGSFEGVGRGEEIDSILDVNGKLIFKATPSGRRFEIRQLTDKGNELIEEVFAKYMYGADQEDLRPNEPGGWYPDYELHTTFEALGKCWSGLDGRDVRGFFNALWDSPEHCQPPRFMERALDEIALEYERRLEGGVQAVRVVGFADKDESGADCRAYYVSALMDGQPYGTTHRCIGLDEAKAFCKEHYGIEAED